MIDCCLRNKDFERMKLESGNDVYEKDKGRRWNVGTDRLGFVRTVVLRLDQNVNRGRHVLLALPFALHRP